MITENLFKEVLVRPAKDGANRLYIVSGYATAAMAFHHLQFLQQNNCQISSVELIVGMSVMEGLSESNHRGFQQLVQNDFPGVFSCSYLIEMPPVHSKVYVWYRNDEPFCSFVGSANYTQTAFGRSQREVMTLADAEKGLDYFRRLIDQSIYCHHPDAETFVQIYNDKNYERVKREQESEASLSPALLGLPFVTVDLITRNGNPGLRSGLNWGQRPGREPNQAYIRLPTQIAQSDFFPPRGVHFTVLTDDGKVLTCCRAQDRGKAIETPHNNSQIGEYFRHRLGLPNGAFISTEALRMYGRTTVDFYKIDDETYFMDFSVSGDG